MGEEIMARNNPFLGLSDQMFHRVKECESWCLQKNRKGFQEALPTQKPIYSLESFLILVL